MMNRNIQEFSDLKELTAGYNIMDVTKGYVSIISHVEDGPLSSTFYTFANGIWHTGHQGTWVEEPSTIAMLFSLLPLTVQVSEEV